MRRRATGTCWGSYRWGRDVRLVRYARRTATTGGSPKDDPLFVRRHKPDYQIVLYMGLLMLLGIVVMYAIGPQRANVLNNAYGADYNATYFFIKQLASVGLALAAFAIMASLPITFLQRFAGKILLGGFVACALLVLLGNVLHVEAVTQCSLGACRWFSVGALGTVQPAELLKFGLLMYGGVFLGVRMRQGEVNSWEKTIIPVGVILLLAIAFIIGFQKDMGTGIAAIAIVVAMVFLAGINRRIGATLLAGLVALGVMLIIIAPHRMERVATFFSGDNHAGAIDKGDNYQVEHAKLAIGTGGVAGVGIGNSVEATGYLPEAINDSVFAIMGETFGFVGLMGVLALFTALLLRLLRIADHLIDPRLKLMVVGVFAWFGTHVVLNIASMTGIFPLTGITLPLLSFGGTSMIFIAGALGLAFQLSRYTAFGSKLKESYETDQSAGSRRRVGRTRYTSRHRSS